MPYTCPDDCQPSRQCAPILLICSTDRAQQLSLTAHQTRRILAHRRGRAQVTEGELISDLACDRDRRVPVAPEVPAARGCQALIARL